MGSKVVESEGENPGEGQLIKASSFNNANVITRTGPHTCIAPNRINTGHIEGATGTRGACISGGRGEGNMQGSKETADWRSRPEQR